MSENKKRCITDDLSDMDTKTLMDALPSYWGSFGNIFSSAFLHCRFDFSRDIEGRFFSMAEGYFEASIELIERCLENRRGNRADIWIFPILFNIIHGIEIYLKGFNSLYRIHAGLKNEEKRPESKIEGKHNIRQLCQVAIKMLRDNKEAELLDEMLFVEKFIDILCENVDEKDMDFARYPIKRNKDTHFYAHAKPGDEENVTINLNVLCQWVLRIFKILDVISWGIANEIEDMEEWRAEMIREHGLY